MNGQAEKLCNAIDRLLLGAPRKMVVADPEVRELLRVARLRRQAGRAMAALGSRCGDEAWRRVEASRQVR
jgi:hypothetical protein